MGSAAFIGLAHRGRDLESELELRSQRDGPNPRTRLDRVAPSRNPGGMSDDLFQIWLDARTASGGVQFYEERPGCRADGLRVLRQLVVDHFVGEATVMKAGGYAKAAGVIQNSLPVAKRTRSGDLGELLATEYLDSQTPYKVPIRKLRWKSDRDMPMHGNDVIGIDTTTSTPRVLKGECKSRASFTPAVAKEAAGSLDAHEGRPNPSTLAFITKRLYEEGRDSEAEFFRKLQADGAMRGSITTHLVFALCGNDASAALAATPKPKNAGIKRMAAAVKVSGHGAFVGEVFQQTYGTRS
jgi:hypothetical protein